MGVTFRVSDPDGPMAALPAAVELPSLLASMGIRRAVASGGPQTWLKQPHENALVTAAGLAFALHRRLVLSPDDIWFTILQGLAAHVAKNAEELRPRLVAHEGRMLVRLDRPDLHPNAQPPGDWSTAPRQLAAHVRAQLGVWGRALEATFTTTDADARVALDVALLETMSSYFDYRVRSLCAIPEITLLGTPADWRDVHDRLDGLERFEMHAWVAVLRRVLAQFVRAANGDVDRDFWRRLYKLEAWSGGPEVHGWINTLFPYLRGAEASRPRDVAPFYALDPFAEPGDAQPHIPKTDDFPLGLSRVPFLWELDHGEERRMELCAGHLGVVAEGDAVRPRFGWFVAPEAAARRYLLTPEDDRTVNAKLTAKNASSLFGIDSELEGWQSVVLWLWSLPELTSLNGVQTLTSLTRIQINDCPITTLASLSGLPNLAYVSIEACPQLTNLSALATLPALETVWIGRVGAQLPPELRGHLKTPEQIAALRAHFS